MILPIVIPIQIIIHYTPDFVSKLSHIVIGSCVICLFVSTVSVFANFIDYCINGYNNETSAVVVMHVFFALLAVFGVLGVVGAVRQVLVCLQVAFVVWVVLQVLWLVVCCVVFISWYNIPELCINQRCPESLWLSDFYHLSFKENKTWTANATGSLTTVIQELQEGILSFDGVALNSHPSSRRDYVFVTFFLFTFMSFFFFFVFLGSMVYNFCDALVVVSRQDTPLTVPSTTFVVVLPFKAFYEAASTSEPEESTDDKNKVKKKTNNKTVENPDRMIAENTTNRNPQKSGEVRT